MESISKDITSFAGIEVPKRETKAETSENT